MFFHCQTEPILGGFVNPNTHLSSLQNPRVKDVMHLRNKSERDETDKFLIEGYRELLRATDAGLPIETLFYCPELFLGTNENALIQRLQKRGTQLLSCTTAVFHKMAYRDRPDGLLAIAKQKHLTLDQLWSLLSKKASPLLVVAEAIEKPGNLGTILRSADAAGADGLIVCDRCTDIHNPNVVRASVGTLFTVPVVEAPGLETLHWLQSHGFTILAASPHADYVFTEAPMQGPLAIVMGTEQLGLSKHWMDNATLQVKIPMHGVADSLNVAMATTLLLYEAIRQRTKSS